MMTLCDWVVGIVGYLRSPNDMAPLRADRVTLSNVGPVFLLCTNHLTYRVDVHYGRGDGLLKACVAYDIVRCHIVNRLGPSQSASSKKRCLPKLTLLTAGVLTATSRPCSAPLMESCCAIGKPQCLNPAEGVRTWNRVCADTDVARLRTAETTALILTTTEVYGRDTTMETRRAGYLSLLK